MKFHEKNIRPLNIMAGTTAKPILCFLMVFFTIIFSEAKNFNADSLEFDTYLTKGNSYLGLQSDSSIHNANNAIKIAQKTGDNKRLIIANLLLSNAYRYEGRYYEAIAIVADKLSLARVIYDKNLEADCLYALGELNRAIMDHKMALVYLDDALKIYSQSKNNVGVAKCLNRKSAVYFQEGKYELAVLTCDSSISVAGNDQLLIANNLELRGAAISKMKRFREALENYSTALEIMRSLNSTADIPNLYANIANTYYLMEDYSKAIEFGMKGLEMARKYKTPVYVSQTCWTLTDSYNKLKDFEKALYYFKQADSARVYLFEKKRDAEVAQLNAKYEIEKSKHENALLRLDNNAKEATIKQQNIIFITGSIIFLVILILAYVLYHDRRKIRKANELLNFHKQETENQKEKLLNAFIKLKELEKYKESLSGMIAHDLVNPLGIILNPPTSMTQYEQIKSMQRSGRQMLHLVMNFLDIQKYEEGKMKLDAGHGALQSLVNDAEVQVSMLLEQKKQKITGKIPEGIAVFGDAQVIVRIFVNLFSNAIKFSPVNSEIIVDAVFENGFVKISVIDPGEGIPEEFHRAVFDKYSQVVPRDSGTIRSTGLGLAFCKLAVEAHGGEIGVVSKQNYGATFWFTLKPGNTSLVSEQENISGKQGEKIFLFTHKEIESIKPCIEKLKSTEIYKLSALKSIIREMEQHNNENISGWLTELKQAISSGNEAVYKQLLSAFTDTHAVKR